MENLVEKLAKTHGLTAVQASSILNTIKEFADENFPSKGDLLEAILVPVDFDPNNQWPTNGEKGLLNSYPLYTLQKRKAV